MLDSNQRPLRCECSSTSLTLADILLTVLTIPLKNPGKSLTFTAALRRHSYFGFPFRADTALTQRGWAWQKRAGFFGRKHAGALTPGEIERGFAAIRDGKTA